MIMSTNVINVALMLRRADCLLLYKDGLPAKDVIERSIRFIQNSFIRLAHTIYGPKIHHTSFVSTSTLERSGSA